MRAMILAAGRGERLRPLTDHCPKPLIKVGGIPLICRHIEKLKAAGIREIVVNSAWLSSMIVDFLGDGSRFGVSIVHSVEGPGGLETAGGIIKALPHLGETFVTINGDTLIDGDYRQFLQPPDRDFQACLYLVPNPAHHPGGDFSLGKGSAMIRGGEYTFSGAAVYRAAVFAGRREERLPLRPVFDELIAAGTLQGRLTAGQWFDVGTLQRLQQVEDYLAARGGNTPGLV